MLGQSVAARAGTKALMGAMGADPITQAVASRVVGWSVAHLTLDHHSQVIAEVADHAHDTYNIAEHFADYDDYDSDMSEFSEGQEYQTSQSLHFGSSPYEGGMHDVDRNWNKPYPAEQQRVINEAKELLEQTEFDESQGYDNVAEVESTSLATNKAVDLLKSIGMNEQQATHMINNPPN